MDISIAYKLPGMRIVGLVMRGDSGEEKKHEEPATQIIAQKQQFLKLPMISS